MGGANKSTKFFLALSTSSRVNNLSNCDAARCSPGRRFGLHVISSRKSIVCVRSFSSCSKSWKCFDTQCLKENAQIQKFIWNSVADLCTLAHLTRAWLLENSQQNLFDTEHHFPLMVRHVDLMRRKLLCKLNIGEQSRRLTFKRFILMFLSTYRKSCSSR